MLANPSLGRLAHLGLIVSRSEPGFDGDEILRALLRSPRLGQLETLDLGGLAASDAAWAELAAAAPRLSLLRELRLTTWALGPDDEIDDWMLGVAEEVSTLRRMPRDRAPGALLSRVLPVRWMPARLVRYDFVHELYPEDGEFVGMWGDSEGFVERRR
jgi:hypothetical protein